MTDQARERLGGRIVSLFRTTNTRPVAARAGLVDAAGDLRCRYWNAPTRGSRSVRRRRYSVSDVTRCDHHLQAFSPWLPSTLSRHGRVNTGRRTTTTTLASGSGLAVAVARLEGATRGQLDGGGFHVVGRRDTGAMTSPGGVRGVYLLEGGQAPPRCRSNRDLQSGAGWLGSRRRSPRWRRRCRRAWRGEKAFAHRQRCEARPG